jgi:hypothetical protein
MMKILLPLLLVLMAFPAFAQPPAVTVHTQNAVVDALTLSDIDFFHSSSPKWLFTIELQSTQLVSGVTMTITMDITLANGDVIQPAVTLTTTKFDVNRSRSFTNLDFANNSALVASFVLSDDVKKKRQGDILSSQNLPAGTYSILVNVTPPAGQPVSDNFAFVLTNPSSIELVSPTEGEQVTGRFPLFQWRFDGAKSRIKVFEQLPGQSALEEAVNGVPMAVAEVTTNAYQYPSAGVRSLQPGRSYVWFVEGATRTTGGADYTTKSPLRSFTLATEGAPSMQTYLDELERALGAQYKPIFDQIRAEGLAPTGSLRIDAGAATTLDLLRLITQFRNDPASVLHVSVE